MYAQVVGILQTKGINDIVPYVQSLQIIRGNDLNIDGYMNDDTNTPVNITGGTVQLALKKTFDSNLIYLGSATMLDAAHGKWNLMINNTVLDLTAGAYIMQVIYTAANGYRDYPVPVLKLVVV